MALLDSLLVHFRAEAERLKESAFAEKALADFKSIEEIALRRAKQAEAALAVGEHEAAAWLTSRLHDISAVPQGVPVAAPPADVPGDSATDPAPPDGPAPAAAVPAAPTVAGPPAGT